MSFGHATEFISFCPPPGTALDAYDHKAPHDQQPCTIPATFREAMDVREQVYVHEQKCSLESEVDEDDARSFHWVVYASVGTNSSPSRLSKPSTSTAATSRRGNERRASESTANRVPVGTIRLVPPPHPLHTGSHSPEPVSETSRSDSKAPSRYQEPKEPYVKLGRLSTIAPYRGLGLSKLLYSTAENWASTHPSEVIPRMNPAEIEAAKLEGKKEPDFWEGLVLVHAQVRVQGLWEKFGFVVDKKMGSWTEEGIEHIGMWKRLQVKGSESMKPLEAAWE